MSSDILPADSLRRSRSTGDLPSGESSRTERAHSTHRSDNLHILQPALIQSDPPSPDPDPLLISSRSTWSPAVPRVAEEEHIEIGLEQPAAPRRRRSLLVSILAFLGFGQAQGARKELVTVCFSFVWNAIQMIAIVVVLVVAASTKSSRYPHLNQWQACNKPLGVWCSIWFLRAMLSFTIAYWTWRNGRGPNIHVDPEINNLGPALDLPNATNRHQGGRPAAGARTNPAPTTRAFHRINVLYSVMTLVWFLASHVLLYTSLYTCRLSSPILWWLTFSILSIMYLKILEILFLGIVVFIIAPILFLFWNILLVCLGRHPLQNPATIIRPEIEKLPKSVVDAIPLVMYIPPPPDDHNEGPIKYPPSIHAYPPKTPPTPTPKRRFRWLRRKLPKDKQGAGNSSSSTSGEKSSDKEGPQTWEDCWEQGDYPFVRLEGNRAACAICLLDFAEPKRIAGGVGIKDDTKNVQSDADAECGVKDTQEITTTDVVEEDRCGALKLTDAGEGPQPLRLLQCGHVFHKTCLDPWLQDVSGRCPLCQRPVVVAEPEKKKRSRRA